MSLGPRMPSDRRAHRRTLLLSHAGAFTTLAGYVARRRRGQALVEFALILPILMLLVTGLLQFGVLLSSQIAFVNGVREAARYGSVLQTADVMQASTNGAAVNTRLNEVLDAGMPAFEPSRLVGAQTCYMKYNNPGSSPATLSVQLTVSGAYRHELFLPIISSILDPLDGTGDGFFALSASEIFRVENPPLPASDLPATPPGTCVP
jgi:Flp pilus assembly protein TadG